MPPWRSYHAEEDGDAPILEGSTKPDPHFNGLLGNDPHPAYLALREMAIRLDLGSIRGFHDVLGVAIDRFLRGRMRVTDRMDV